MRVPLNKVPIADRRRAARALESMLSAPAEGRKDLAGAHLAGEAMPMHRPDLKDIAYWEFEVGGIETVLPIDQGGAKEFDRGFLIVATGSHDVPLPHFSLDLAPPSRRLEQFTGTPHRILKMDSLCYAVEDARGALLGHIGMMPPRLEGMPDELPKRPPEGWATTLDAGGEVDRTGDDKLVEKMRLRRSREQRPVKMAPWKSWDDAKDGYAKSYALHLAVLAERAEHPWRIEELTDKFGQGIHSGETFSVPMLERGDHALVGPGAEFVRSEINTQALPPRLILTPRAGIDATDLTFEVHFSYSIGKETLTFFIVPEGAPTTIPSTDSPLGPTFER